MCGGTACWHTHDSPDTTALTHADCGGVTGTASAPQHVIIGGQKMVRGCHRHHHPRHGRQCNRRHSNCQPCIRWFVAGMQASPECCLAQWGAAVRGARPDQLWDVERGAGQRGVPPGSRSRRWQRSTARTAPASTAGPRPSCPRSREPEPWRGSWPPGWLSRRAVLSCGVLPACITHPTSVRR